MPTTNHGADKRPDCPTDQRAGEAARRMALGRHGEDVAERHLRLLGMVSLDRNWRGDDGELDLVMRDGDTLVVVEVKTRSSAACGAPHEAITPTKLARLRRLAAQWLRGHAASPSGIRIDLVAVTLPRRGPAVVDHVRGLS